MRKVGSLGTWWTGRRIELITSTEYVTILFGMEGGGLGADGRAFCYLNLWQDSLILDPLGYLPIRRSLGRLEIKRELDSRYLMETCLVLISLLSKISTC